MGLLYSLRRPCAECPFLKRAGTCLPIAQAFTVLQGLIDQEDYVLPCHLTTGDGEKLIIPGETQHCAGALILWEKYSFRTQQTQLALSAGTYTPATLEGHGDVYDSITEMLRASLLCKCASRRTSTGVRLRTIR